MQNCRWMKNGKGEEIRVNDAQVAAFKKRGYSLFEKPVEEPRVARQAGRQMNMGSVVRMEREGQSCFADPRQIEAMTKAGWKVSKKQPVPKGEVPVYRAIKGRDPVMGRIRMVHAASGAECFADDKQVSAMEAAGWVDPSKPAASAAAVVGGEMQMSVPPMIVKLQPFSAHVEQQLQGVTEEVAGVQFSSEAEGAPWVTAGGPGSGGAIEAAPVQFSAQNPSWDYPVIVARAHCWMRVGVWADQILSGPPVVTSNAVEIRPKAVAPQSDPEPRPSK